MEERLVWVVNHIITIQQSSSTQREHFLRVGILYIYKIQFETCTTPIIRLYNVCISGTLHSVKYSNIPDNSKHKLRAHSHV